MVLSDCFVFTLCTVHLNKLHDGFVHMVDSILYILQMSKTTAPPGHQLACSPRLTARSNFFFVFLLLMTISLFRYHDKGQLYGIQHNEILSFDLWIIVFFGQYKCCEQY